MNDVIKKISLTRDIKQGDVADDYAEGTDVIVEFGDDDQYVATFYSVNNLRQMMDGQLQSKEYETKGYYKILNAVIVKDLYHLFPVIEAMMGEGDFQLIFKKI